MNKRRMGTAILVVLVVILTASNLLTLVNAGAHARLYALVESTARALGVEETLSSSPTQVNRRIVEVTARQSAEAAVRQQRLATASLIANSLVLVDATRTLIRDHQVLKQAHSTLADTAKTISRRVGVRTAASATRSVTTLAGKALPYVGTASVLALMAYDVADACQTVKDANELSVVAGIGKVADEITICGLQVPSVDQVRAWAGGLWH